MSACSIPAFGTGFGNVLRFGQARLLTFKGKTEYRFECTHQEKVPHARATAAEIERGCAEIVRTFKVAD